MNWLLDVVPPPAILVLPPAAVSLDEAHAAIEFYEHYTKKTLDPSQRLVVEVMMAQRDDNRWAAPTTGRAMPRQNGKGDELECVEMWGLVQRSEAILHTIHDAVLLATQTQERMLATLESHPDLRKKIKRKWTGTGQQMIEMRNGGIVWYRTRTGGGGRGVDDIDRLVIDEAQHATDDQLAAMTPTLFANSNPQMNIVGTAGLDGKSFWWWNVRKRALSDDPGNFGYVEHTAEGVRIGPDGRVEQTFPDVHDRELWMACNPALHAGRGRGIDFLDEQLRNMGPAKFAQEHMCVWAPEPDAELGPISLERWAQLVDLTWVPDEEDPSLRLCLDAPPDRTSATFAVAAKRPNGQLHVQVRFHVPPNQMRDLVSLAKGLSERHNTPLIVPPSSPALAWQAELESAGVELYVLKPSELAAAYGYILVAIAEGTLRHRGQPEMDNAVAGLQTKTAGDVDVPTRRDSKSNVAPFIAATCALARVPEAKPAKAVLRYAFT
jgi:hypothetical protein